MTRSFTFAGGARKRAALLLAGSILGCATASGAGATTYVWTTGNYVSGGTSPNPLLAGDVLAIQSSANKSFGTDFTNASGQVDWSDGNLFLFGGSTVTNGGLWRALGDNSLSTSTGGGDFANSGTFRKETGTGVTSIAVAFSNSGTIDTLSGILRFSSGSTTFDSGTVFSGTGITQVASNATFNGAFSSANLDLTAGAYTGSGAILSGTADYIGGTFAGDWTIASGAALTITNSQNKTITGSFTNQGTVGWTDGNLFLGGASTVTNNGDWLATGDNSMSTTTGGGTFVNNGTFAKTGGVGTTSIALPFVNNGTIDAQTGTIRFSGGGLVFNDGTVITGAGDVAVTSGGAFNGSIASANLDFAGGIYTGSNALLSGTAEFLGGGFAGTWTIDSGATLAIGNSANKSLSGIFTNAGTVDWSDGALFLTGGMSLINDGAWVAYADDGISDSTGAGTVFNNGLFQKVGGSGSTTISSAFVNSGTIDAQSGTIRFSSSGKVFNAGTAFTGAGTVAINSGATFNGAFSSENLDFAGGTFTGSGALMSGSADFTDGTFDGGWTIGSTAELVIGGGSNKGLSGSFANAGTVTWNNGSLFLSGGASVTNAGTWTATGDDAFSQSTGGGSFTNTGLFEKTGGTGTTSFAVPLVNQGTIDVRSGTIALPSNFANDGTLAGDGRFSLSGTLTNNGTIAPGEGGSALGTLTLNGNYVQTAGGLFDVQIGSGGFSDLFLVNGTASLDGTLGLSCLSCSFSVGDIFTLLDATGNLTGIFSSVTTSGFNDGFAYTVLYDDIGDRVQLRIDNVGMAAVPEPATWAMMIAGFGFVGGAMRRRGAASLKALA